VCEFWASAAQNSRSLLAGWQSPLIEFISQLVCRLLSETHSYNQNKINAPCVMMTFAAVNAKPWFTSLLAWSVVARDDMRQLVQARLLALPDVAAAVSAYLDSALKRIGVTAPAPAGHGHGVGMRGERGLEPVHPLDGMYISRAIPIIYYILALDQHFAGELADRQAGCQLRVISRFL
jgi:hypothetical protein